MPLELQTPLNLGQLSTHEYTHARIQEMVLSPSEKCIRVTTALGYVENGAFVCGLLIPGVTIKTFVIRDEPGDPPTLDYWRMITKTVGPDGSALIYDRAAQELYQWLLDKGHFQGRIV